MSLRGSLRGLFVKPHQQVQAVEARGRTGGGAMLLDVRKSNEWEDGHVQAPGTSPWGSWASGREAARRSAGHHVCCSGAWSACAGSLLAGQGRDVSNLRGGMRAWVASGLPVVAKGGRRSRGRILGIHEFDLVTLTLLSCLG